MPNFCENKLTVSGPSDSLEKFVEFAEGPDIVTWKDHGEPQPDSSLVAEPGHTLLSLPKLVPPGEAAAQLRWDEPKKWYDNGHIRDIREITEWITNLDAGLVQPRDGYEWQLQNWGTMWEVSVLPNQRTIEDGVARYEFDTAWSPIRAAVRRFAPKWPDLNFRLEFIETGNDFYGETEYALGELVRDYETKIEPRHLRAFYGLSDETLLTFLKERYEMTDEEVSQYLTGSKEARVEPSTAVATSSTMQDDPASKVPNTFEQQVFAISSMIRRLARVNGREIGPDDELNLGYCVGQLMLLAQKIQEQDDQGDLSGYAALPRLLHDLCGSEIRLQNTKTSTGPGGDKAS